MITFFLLNEESTHLIHSGNSALNFRYQMDSFLTTNKNTPEDAIAYEEEFVKSLLDKHGLVISLPIYYGSWCNREKFFTYQDLIVGEKINDDATL